MSTTVKRRASGVARRTSRILVVGKITSYMQAIEDDARQVYELLAAGNPAVANMLSEHEAHAASLMRVVTALAKHQIEIRRVDDLTKLNVESANFDYVIVVGGDGTVLAVSHHLRRTPVLGVKSAPRSHGHFCLADPDTLPAILEAIRTGKRKPLSLMRINAFIDGTRVGPDVLNEVLLESTTSTTNYVLHVGDKQEEQASDGIFFATAAGSTAWARAYGSDIVPVTERSIQFLVRGAFINPLRPLRLLQGFSSGGCELSVVAKNTDAKVAVDGRRNLFPIARGSRLVIRPSEHDLRIFADANCNQRYLASQAARFPRRLPSVH